jgi:RNA polymerase sigma-70 factor (ECF subfamily)
MSKLLVKSMRMAASPETTEVSDVPEVSDEALLLRYRSHGDRKAYAELVHRYEGELYNYLRRYLNDGGLAEDAFQMTFLQVHLKCGQFDETRAFRPWLYTIATNQAIDEQRRNKRHRSISLNRPRAGADNEDLTCLINLLGSRECDPAGGFDTAQNSEWVRAAVNALPEVLRSALVLVYYQGLKYREAAEVLDAPVGTVKSRIHAAILKLTEEWQAAESDITK